MKSITVRIPGSSANLGPGFDSFGIALSIYNTMRFTERESGLSFYGCHKRYKNEHNLAYRAYRDTFLFAGRPAPHVHIEFLTTDIPVAHGLGSSAALLVGGAVAANRMMGDPLTREQLLRVTTRIEGHPDNLAAAIFGGLTVSLTEGGVPYTLPSPLSSRIGFRVFIPDFGVSTREARRVLPRVVPHADAAYNLSHAAFLLRAMESGDKQSLSIAFHDKLHQPYRMPLFREYAELEALARDCGAAAFCISGSGSTLLAITVDGAFDEGRLAREITKLRHIWKSFPIAVDRVGATVTDESEIQIPNA